MCPAVTSVSRFAPSNSFSVFAGPPFTAYASSRFFTPKSSCAFASTKTSSIGDAVVSRPGFEKDTDGG